MKRHAAALYAAKPGYPLDTKVELEFGGKSPDLVEDTMEYLSRKLSALGLVNFYFNVVGFGSKGSARAFDGSESTLLHEEAHRDLREHWESPENSFDEGLAHAAEDFRFADQEKIRRRRFLSKNLPILYRDFSDGLKNGGLKHRRLMNRAIELPGYDHSHKNWASFLRTFESFRHYDMFMELFEMEGAGSGMEEVFRIARIVSESDDSEQGILLLEDYLRECGRYVSYDAEELPVCDLELWDFDSTFRAGGNDEGYKMFAQTSNDLVDLPIRNFLRGKEAVFRRLSDS
jgi:hypothetical protein